MSFLQDFLAKNETIVITAVVTALASLFLTLTFNKTVIPILNFVFKPFIYLKNALYNWLAPKNPFSISIRNYKRHVLMSKISRIENPVGPAISIGLEKAFAPLKLISDHKKESIDLFEHLAANNRTIILGGAGTGKTTLMKSLVLNVLTKQTRTDLDNLIPVFIKLRTLSSKEYSVEQAIIAAFKEYHFPGADNFINSAIDQGKLIIILDGLDEVGLNRSNVIRTIQRFQTSKTNRL
jgi:Cdc6-like AAA superfamily ATPase